jgi:hypothetical protein
MNVRAQWIALLLLIGLLLGGAACSSTSEDDVDEGGDGSVGDGDGDGDTGGDGDGDGDTGGDGDGDGDTGGDGDGDGDTGGDGDGDGDVTPNDDDGGADGIQCGAEVCESEGGCCADPFQSLCGAAIGTRGCIKPPEPDENSDPRCPEVSIPGFFVLPSCCVDGMCGVNAMGFGAPTACSELGMLKTAVEEMTGGMAPFAIPAPQACD